MEPNSFVKEAIEQGAKGLSRDAQLVSGGAETCSTALTWAWCVSVLSAAVSTARALQEAS